MSLHHVILGLLERGDMSGYDVKVAMRDTAPNFWSVSDGQLYPALRRLAAQQYIEPVQTPDGQEGNFYRITPEGKAEFLDWLKTPDRKTQNLKDGFLVRLIHFDRLTKDEVLRHLQKQRRAVQSQLDQIHRQRARYTPGSTSFQCAILDLALVQAECRDLFLQRLAQYVEAGKLSRTEPLIPDEAIAALVHTLRQLDLDPTEMFAKAA